MDCSRALGDAEGVYRAEWKSCVRLAGLLIGDYQIGEDFAQEAFARLVERWPDVGEPNAYVRRIVVNLCRSWIRRAAVARRIQQSSAVAVTALDDRTERLADRDALCRTLAGLPRRQREAVVLRFYADLTEPNIAAAMGVSIGCVKVHLHRAMKTLAERVEAPQ